MNLLVLDDLPPLLPGVGSQLGIRAHGDGVPNLFEHRQIRVAVSIGIT